MTASARFHASADLALAVYLEPHAEQRRVLLLGGVDAPLSAHLERVAQHLDVIDPAAREQGTGEVPELPFDDESFDLIVVADADALPEPRRDAVRELHRTLARDGLLAVAGNVGGKNGASSEALERLLATEFGEVRLLSQAPMFGYALRDVEASRAELSIDTSLLRERADRPERVIVIAADRQLKLDPRLWVQVPAAELSSAGEAEVDPNWVESLRRAEDEARRALGRESELLRELSRERKAREAAESATDRNKALERKLLAIEADYDDAVGRVRYFEGLLLEREEREAAEQSDRSQRVEAERELGRAHKELSQLHEKLKAAEADQAGLRASAEGIANDSAEHERRLAELASELSAALRETRRQEAISRDLLEELRGLEQRALVAVEHDARVAELEAERERAMQRALEAEVARESAQMRVDELRAQLELPVSAAPQDDERERLAQELDALRRYHADQLEALSQQQGEHVSQLDALRGERTGLRLRLLEAEQALLGEGSAQAAAGRELDTRLALAEARAQAAIEALGAAEESLKSLRAEADQGSAARGEATRGSARVQELEAVLVRREQRIEALERELEEADRFAEEHADDVNRLEALEGELSETRHKLDAVDDEVRAFQDELFASRESLRERDAQLSQVQENLAAGRAEIARAVGESTVRLEQLTRRESELRAERDDAHAALAEARAILAHLAVRVGADTHDLPAIMQALDQHSAPPSMLDALRKALVDAQGARSDAEYQLSRLSLQLEERDERVRQLEESLHTPQAPRHNFDPPEV